MPLKPNILLIAPSKNSRGGIVSMVSTLYSSDFLRGKYNFRWIETQSGRGLIRNILTLLKALLIFHWILPKVDLVHVHTASYNSFRRKSLFIMLCILFHRPYIVHIHSGAFLDFLQHSRFLSRQYYVFCLKHAKVIVTLAKTFSQKIQQYVPCVEISEIPNPGRFDMQKKILRKNVNLIMFAGRIEKEKGVFDLLHAFAQLNLPQEIKLAFVGNGKISEVCKIAEELKIINQVILPGWQNLQQIKNWYQKADIFVLPSYVEAMPMVLLEAMAYGIPIISTSVGGIPATLPPNAEEYLYHPGNIDELKFLLTKLISSYDERVWYSQELQKYFHDNFTPNEIFVKFRHLYTKALIRQDTSVN